MRWPMLVAAMLLAGCFGGCPATTTGVTWTDPALFAAIDREARMEDAGLPVQGAWVVEVTKEVTVIEGGNFRLGPGGLSLQVRGGETDADVETGLRLFLENVVQEADEAYVSAFMQSKQVTGEARGPGGHSPVAVYQAGVPEGLRLQPLYDETVGDQEPARTMRGDDWRWRMSYPAKSIVLGPGDLRVDAVGVAEFDHVWPGDTDPAQAEADVRKWLAEAGLPVPDGPMDANTIVC